MNFVDSVAPHLIHVGAVLYLICFLFRDQIALRSFAITGDVAYTAYYFTVAPEPLWEAIAWIIPNMSINIAMIYLILRDRRVTSLSDDEMSLFQNLRGLNPGQFRRLMKLGNWENTEASKTLAEEGQPLDRLYYVLRGEVEVKKGERKLHVDPTVFIGELAYLRKKPATATVSVSPGSVLVSWAHKDLEKALAKDEALNNALGILLSNDMAEKVARG